MLTSAFISKEERLPSGSFSRIHPLALVYIVGSLYYAVIKRLYIFKIQLSISIWRQSDERVRGCNDDEYKRTNNGPNQWPNMSLDSCLAIQLFHCHSYSHSRCWLQFIIIIILLLLLLLTSRRLIMTKATVGGVQ